MTTQNVLQCPQNEDVVHVVLEMPVLTTQGRKLLLLIRSKGHVFLLFPQKWISMETCLEPGVMEKLRSDGKPRPHN